ncbi:YfbR-like 5'-deoxynucleotidase, partial [Vibrio coralliirubri]
SAGNHEYEQAKRRLEETLEQRKSPEMDYFLTTFAPSFELSLDEIS